MQCSDRYKRVVPNSKRSDVPLSRELLLPLMAKHVLKHGMAGASLRPLAQAAGTSDRMLIYHFGNKERLISELLKFIADAYSHALDRALSGARPKSRKELLDRIISHTSGADMEPFLALWWEIVAGAARDVPGYKQAAQSVMSRLLEWLIGQMPKGDPDPEGGAQFLLTMIEGAQMLSTVGHESVGQGGIAAARL